MENLSDDTSGSPGWLTAPNKHAVKKPMSKPEPQTVGNNLDAKDSFLEIDERILRAAAESAANLLKSLANEQRLLILCKLLAHQEMTVGEIAGHVSLSQSALSQHLARLRAEGLVSTRKSRQHVHYSLCSNEAKMVIETLYSIYCSPANK